MSRDRWIRIGLLYLAAGAALVGLWALPAPRSWFDDFPGGGRHWAAAQPPYNEHLVRDVGALYLGFVVLFLWSAWRPARALVVPVCWAWVVVQVPHLVFHLANDDGLSGNDWVLQGVGLAGLVVVAGAVALASSGARHR
jgi:hypothetical protein